MKKVKKVLAMALVSTLLMQNILVPVSAAEDPFETAAPTAGEMIRPESVSEGGNDLQVVFEVEEQREAAVKHFRLSDGSYVAASYPSAIHYESEDGIWKDIDNTLILKENKSSSDLRMGESSENQSYAAVNGENEKAYAAVLRPDEKVLSVINSEYGLGLSVLRPETADNLLENAVPILPEDNPETSPSPEPEPTLGPEGSPSPEPKPALEPEDFPSPELEPTPEVEVSPSPELEPTPEVEVSPSPEPEPTPEVEESPSPEPEPTPEVEESPSPEPESTPEVEESPSPEPESTPEVEESPSPEPTETPSVSEGVPALVENPGDGNDNPGGEGDEPGEQPGPGGDPTPEDPQQSVAEQVQPELISSKVTYENIFPGVDLIYQNYGFNIKESILVKSKQDSYRYSFLMNFDGLTPIMETTGGVSLQNSAGETVYEIPAPYMVDGNQTVSHDAEYELSQTEKGYVLTVEADPLWMEDPSRVYPISIDPTFILYGGDYQGSITATSLTEGSSVTGAGGESIYIGTDYAGRELQAFLQFGKLPTLPSNCTVATAVLGLYQHTYSAVAMNRLFVRAHEVTGDRPSQYSSAAQWIRSMTWATRPEFSEEVEAYARMGNGNTGAYAQWDISRIVSKWYSSKQEDRLLAMDAIGPEAFTSSKYAASVFWMNVNNTPIFLIYYQNNVGIEDRFTYQNIPVDRAGTAYVGDFTEQLTAEVPLFSSNNEVLPFTISAYYNSPYRGRYFSQNDGFGMHTADYSNMNIGSGWKLSVQETIMKITVKTDNVSTDYYVYTDADGTEHYFEAKSPAPYKDEEGLGYSLSVSGTTYTLSDETGNKKEFVNGYLTRIIDTNGNIIYYLYNDNTNYSASNPFPVSGSGWKPKANQANKVTQVWQINDNGSAADIQSLICKLSYSGNRLSSITDKTGRAYTFTYETPSTGPDLLTKITFPDGCSAQYDYSDGAHLLTKLYDDETDFGYEFTYQLINGNYSIQSGKEYVASSINGTQSVGDAWNVWIPSLQQRLYRFYGMDRTKDTEDDILIGYTFDLTGRTVNIIDYNTDRTDIIGTSAATYTKNSGTSKKNNKATGSSSSGIATPNLLSNSGMEVEPDNLFGWAKGTQPSGAGIAFRTEVNEISPVVKPRTGSYLMKMFLPNNLVSTTGSGNKVNTYQQVYLESGTTYVFSGYANSSGMTTFGKDGGLSLSFQTSSGTDVAESNMLNYSTSNKVEGGWTRLEVTFTPQTSGNYRVSANLKNAAKFAAFDDFQLEKVVVPAEDMPAEKQGVASSANLVQLGGLEKWSASGASSSEVSKYWTYDASRAAPLLSTGEDAHRGYVFQVLGHPDASRRASQTIKVNRSSDTTYMLSAWGKAMAATDSVGPNDMSGLNSTYQRFFGLIAEIKYADTTTPEYQYVVFDPRYDSWQYASGFIVPKRSGTTVSTITVYLAYDYNINTAWFDQITLTEEPAQTYTYNDDGKVVAVTTSSQSTDTYKYNGPDLTQFVSAGLGQFDFTYDSSHNMTKATNDGVNLTAQYDAAGNNTQSKLQKGSSGIYLQNSSTYTSDGNHIATTNDVNNITTTYSYDSQGRKSSQTTPTDTGNLTVAQTYISGNDRVNSNFVSGMLAIVNSYEQGALISTSRKTFEDGIPQWQRYNMPVDAWGNMTAVQVQSGDNVDSEDNVTWSSPITLTSYEYGANGGPIQKLTYGNGDTEAYSYDLYGQLASVQHFSENLLEYVESYAYDSFGNIGRSVVKDGSGNVIADYQYEYDSLGRLIRSQQSGNNVTSLWTQHEYDNQNRLSDQYWRVSDSSLHESYTYNNNNGTLSSMLLGTGRTLSYEYDNLLRISKRNVSGVYQHRRNYIGTGTANRQSNRIQYYVFAGADGNDTKMTYRYDYDTAGNINEVYRQLGAGTLDFLSSYEYDKLGQLTKSTDRRGTETYAYNTAGNLLSRTLAGKTVSYSYDNANWNDLLTAYDGKKIAYEGQTYNASGNTVSGTVVSGNPVSYYNGTRWNMQWVNGYWLAEASSSTTDVTYTYDRIGLRSTKTVNGTTYHYAYAGDKLVWQEWDGNEMFFFYDDTNAPIGFWYHPASGSNVTGYYMTTQQGDITRIEDVNGNVLATYEYDAWGKIISSSGSLADINPLRYRGYYYDTETGFYYLQSRYYDPVVSRFINADRYASTGYGFHSHNMFVYCGNNPVNRVDTDGNFWETIFDVISLGGSIIEVCINPADPWAWASLVGDTIDLIPFVSGVGEGTRVIRLIQKGGDVIEIAKATDFTKDAAKIVKSLDRSSGYTKSSLKAGFDIHKGYKTGDNFLAAEKEFTNITGIRPDYVDRTNRVIYELKPMNPRGVINGIRQLQKYKKAMGGGNWTLRLELY